MGVFGEPARGIVAALDSAVPMDDRGAVAVGEVLLAGGADSRDDEFLQQCAHGTFLGDARARVASFRCRGAGCPPDNRAKR